MIDRTLCLLALAIATSAVPLHAQGGGDQDMAYEREIFRYPRVGRPDPFRSLLLDGDLGIRIEDLEVRGIVHHEDPGRSVVTLVEAGSGRRLQLRTGERVGSVRVLAIYPDRVDIVVEELGVARRETLPIAASVPGAAR